MEGTTSAAASSSKATKHTRRDMLQTPPKSCMLDAMPKEIFDKIMSYLTPKPSTRPFEVMDRGLPVNELDLDIDRWKDIAKGMSAMACLARTAKRYKARVTPHLYENVVLPLRTGTGREPVTDLVKVLAQLGPDTTHWKPDLYKSMKERYDCGGAALQSMLCHQFLRPGPAGWKHTVRLDLRGALGFSMQDTLALLRRMPQLRDLAMQTARTGVEGTTLGGVLQAMCNLRSLSIVSLNEMLQILIALTYIRVELDWLCIECQKEGHQHRSPHSVGRSGWSDYNLKVKKVRNTCGDKEALDAFARILGRGYTRQVSLPGLAGTFLHAATSLNLLKKVQLTHLDISLSRTDDICAIVSGHEGLQCLTLRYLFKHDEDDFCKLLTALPNVQTLALPCAQPYMLLCLLETVEYGTFRKAKLPEALKNLVVGKTSQQLSANHWPPLFKSRVVTLNRDLERACAVKGITFMTDEDGLTWEKWITGPRFVSGRYQDGSWQDLAWADMFHRVWETCHPRLDDDYFHQISAALAVNADADFEAFTEEDAMAEAAQTAWEALRLEYCGKQR